MSSFEVSEPILNSPFDEPTAYWYLREGHEPERREGRRPALVYPPRDDRRQKHVQWSLADGTLRPSEEFSPAYELALVNMIRERVAAWRAAGYPGITRTTTELIAWWTREERSKKLFYAQIEAALTIIFLIEARSDFLQGIAIPRDEPSDDRKAEGFTGFLRYACKMATGAGKTTVMGMLIAWSILNKVASRGDARFSDVAVLICPNVTIRNRLRELDPGEGEASIYRTRDLIPPDTETMKALSQGKVLAMNWHALAPQAPGGESARVVKAGVEVRSRDTIKIGTKNTTARGSRTLTLETYQQQCAAGLLNVIEEETDREGNLIKVRVESVRYVESDTALLNRILGREVGGKQNILVLNDEAHHAYRIKRDDAHGDEQLDLFESGGGSELPTESTTETDDEEWDDEEEATVWIEGLNKIHKQRGINFCVDLSATPYFLGRVGQETNRPFPWVVSDFGLVEAIESGLTKIPQLAVRDTTGREVPGYFNIWTWVLEQMTSQERGGKRAPPKPEAILKYANTPLAMMGGLWGDLADEWREMGEPRTPVFILVCKTTQIAKVIYEWLAEGKSPTGIAPSQLAGFRNRNGEMNTIRVDSKVVHETDTGESKNDEARWMRMTLDTVGKTDWPRDRQGNALSIEGFEELAKKLERPLSPPGRDVRCIVSVGMLTEGWDCNTVTHIIGLRPFQSQLLCEQVVGRGLRRAYYELNAEGKFDEEVAKVFGVPFEVIPFKANKQGPTAPPPVRKHVRALPNRAQYEIFFPRVERYTQAIRNRLVIDWQTIPALVIDPGKIPPEVEVKASIPNNKGRASLTGPGAIENVTLNPFRKNRRIQELVFELAGQLTRDYAKQPTCAAPPHVLFPQFARFAQRYIDEKVFAGSPAEKIDAFLSPYYGLIIERIIEAIRPDTTAGEVPEIPQYEASRPPGTTADVDFMTGRDVREVIRSHVNYVVADTKQWEQSAAYYIDRHKKVAAFVKNAGLGFAIPYMHNGQNHEYIPDFLIRLNRDPAETDSADHLILETKGYDPLEEVKVAAANRWVAAVNAEGSFAKWHYRLVKKVADIDGVLIAL